MAKLKKEFIGQKTYSKVLNKMVLIEEAAATTLLKEGRFDLFDLAPRKKLKPKKAEPKNEEIKEDKEEKE